MNEIRLNAFKALSVAIILTLPAMVLFDDFIGNERERYLIENNCYDTNNICDLFPYHFLLMPIPILIYYLIFNYFEKKRKKTWRSYN